LQFGSEIEQKLQTYSDVMSGFQPIRIVRAVFVLALLVAAARLAFRPDPHDALRQADALFASPGGITRRFAHTTRWRRMRRISPRRASVWR
jgi:hypothetical protein